MAAGRHRRGLGTVVSVPWTCKTFGAASVRARAQVLRATSGQLCPFGVPGTARSPSPSGFLDGGFRTDFSAFAAGDKCALSFVFWQENWRRVTRAFSSKACRVGNVLIYTDEIKIKF